MSVSLVEGSDSHITSISLSLSLHSFVNHIISINLSLSQLHSFINHRGDEPAREELGAM